MTLGPILTYTTSNLNNLRKFLDSNQYIDCNRCKHKKITLATTFHNLTGGKNPYVQLGYIPLTVFYHARGQVSVSMDADPINMIHTSQQLSKEGLNEELDGDFRSSKLKL